MRWVSLVAVGVLLLCPLATTASATSKGIIPCSNSDLNSLPDNWSLAEQSCIRVDLGVQQPGTTLFFDISTDHEIDVLLFSANTVSVYQNEQSYRMDSVWQSESIFESFSGTGEWHWEVPSDRDETRWYLVLDNLAHPQDGGEGAQGGQSVELSLDGGVISPQQFTISDSIHRVGVGEYGIAHGPFSVDHGTYVYIHARTMEGYPDIFVMTESAFSLYSPSVNWTSSSRIVSADMLLVTSELYSTWSASDTNGENLYVIVDNRPGPGGGGAGTSPAAVTLTITLNPVLDPTITSESSLDTVEVGETVILSALDTPNKSEQIDESGFAWDSDGDGIADVNGPTVSRSWESPGNYTVKLWATSIDSRIGWTTIEIQVVDHSDPSVNIGAGEHILKGFGEQLVLSGTFTDNWGIERVDWQLDGVVIKSNYSVTEPSSTLILNITSEYSTGDHIVSLLVTDKAGRSTKENVTVTFIDVSPPEIPPYESELDAVVGDPVMFQIFAQDVESERLEYTWIMEQGTENEIQLSGPQVIHEFVSEGAQYVVCQVENEAGLVSSVEILVMVHPSGSEGGGLGPTAMALIAVVVIALFAVGGFVAFNLAVKRKMSDIIEEEEEESVEPAQSTEVQKAIWGAPGSSPFQPPTERTREPEIESDLSDLDELQTPQEDTASLSLDDSLLAGLDLESEQNHTPDTVDRKIRKGCSSCSRPFELTLPDGIDSAYTNCPYCNSEELVRLDDR